MHRIGIVVSSFLILSLTTFADPWIGYLTYYDDAFWPSGQAGNYGVVKLFLDEDDAETHEFTIQIDVYPDSSTVTNVQLWSNINRRDFAKMYEPESDGGIAASSYYMPYEMSYAGTSANDSSLDTYEVTLVTSNCGVYRFTAYYQLQGDSTKYWHNDSTYDGVNHRDLVIVVSPQKTKELRMYEANVMTLEADAGGTESDRSTLEDLTSSDADGFDPFNLTYLVDELGFNTIWLMPIHPISSERWYNTGSDPLDYSGYLGANYSPGSPYAAQNYWEVNDLFSSSGSSADALEEFTNFVAEAEAAECNVFIDVALNHAGWDVVFGQGAVDLGLVSAADEYDEVRDASPTWCSRGSDWNGGSYYYREPASSGSEASTWAPADQMPRHYWYDAGVDWYYGNYSSLGMGSYGGSYYDDGIGGYDNEEDLFWTWTDTSIPSWYVEVTSNMWEYAAYYFPYWINQTDGKLDGTRLDFSQGLPPQAWEYIINKTRQTKWDFVFLAEVLDDDEPRYRCNRLFDLSTTINHGILRSATATMGDYYANIEEETTLLTYTAAIMWNGTSHDEDPAGADPWLLASRYGISAALHGAPMVYQGQPLGVGEKINFESAWSNMYSYWTDAYYNDPERNDLYRRINEARSEHPSLRELDRYFLETTSGGFNDDIFSMARWADESEDVSWPFFTMSSRDIDLVFVRLDSSSSTETYEIPHDVPLHSNYFYQAYNMVATNPTTPVWPDYRRGDDIWSNGVYISFTFDNEIQYLHLEPAMDITGWFPIPDTDDCAAEAAARSTNNKKAYNAALTGLRKAEGKAKQTSSGNSYVNNYYRYSDALTAILLKPGNEQLCAQAAELVLSIGNAASLYYNQGQDVMISSQDRLKAQSLLKELIAQCNNPEMQKMLRNLQTLSTKTTGKTFSQAFNLFLQAK